MSRLRDLWARFRALSTRDDLEREMDEELRFHLTMATERYVARGLSPGEARRQALLHFGGVERHKEAAREEQWSRWLENAWQDLRYAGRILRRNPRFTAAVVLTLAIGMGATTALFSVVDGILLRPLPFPDPDRVVFLGWDYARERLGVITSLTGYQVAYTREHSRALESVATYQTFERDLGEPAYARATRGLLVSDDFFRVVGIAPALGRSFTDDENRPGGDAVAVVSDAFWRRELGADSGVVGRAIRLDGTSYTVVGVMPRRFRFVTPSEYTEVLVPLQLDPSPRDEGHNYEVLARIRPGWSRQAVDADLAAVIRAMRVEHPALFASPGEGIRQLGFQEAYVGGLQGTLWLLFGAATCVLLIGCANAANLLLARAVTRQREMVVRAAIGAERGRVLRQLLAEGLALSFIAGVAGVVFGTWGLRAFLALGPRALPRAEEIGLDHRALFFSLLVITVTGIGFGLVAALPTRRLDLAGTLGQRTLAMSRRARARDLLVVTETAFAVVLLAGAGLLIASFAKLRAVDPGFSADSVLVTHFARLPREHRSEARLWAFQEQLLNDVRSAPGVVAVGASSVYPLERGWNFPMTIEGRPDQTEGSVEWRAITPGYLEALRIPVRRGHPFAPSDREGSPRVAMVNEAFAQRYFPGENPIGKRIEIGKWKGEWLSPGFASAGPTEIVGVVGDVRETRLDQAARRTVFVPLAQGPGGLNGRLRLVVRTGDPTGTQRQIERSVRALGPAIPPPTVDRLGDRVAASIAEQRFRTMLVTVFAGSALLLTAIGIFAVLSYSVHQRVREIGVRVALGAGSASVLRLVVGRGMLLVGIGTAIGVAAALASTRALSAMLYGVTTTDPGVFLSAVAVLVGIALLAAWIPARRAARVDPVVAIRTE